MQKQDIEDGSAVYMQKAGSRVAVAGHMAESISRDQVVPGFNLRTTTGHLTEIICPMMELS